jgi:hypothetical protein
MTIAAPPAPITALAFHPQGKWLAVARRGEILLLDATSGATIGQVPGQTGQVTAITASRNGDWLAVASGAAGKSGEVRLYDSMNRLARTIPAHADLIPDLAFSTDGKTLATCSYDRLVKLWDTATGKWLRTLKDHSDAVNGLSFQPGGKLLATAAADRTVKIWDTTTGARLYSLGDPTDWVYAVAWHPDGKRLAAAGIDKSLRIWEATATEGRLVRTAFAHEGAVLRLAYSADGQTIYSAGEDRTIKVWNAATLTERLHTDAQPESVLSLALSHDGKRLAVGRYDGALLFLDAAKGKVLGQPLPQKPMPPKPAKVAPAAIVRGTTSRLIVEGASLGGVTGVRAEPAEIVAKIVERSDVRLTIELSVPATTAPGIHSLRLQSAAGETAPLPLAVDRFPLASATPAKLPATFAGSIERSGDQDSYSFEATAGQPIGVQLLLIPGSKLDPIMALSDAAGNVLGEGTASLGHTCAAAGRLTLTVRDREYRGGSAFGYRLYVGPVPVVMSIVPPGVQRGMSAEVRINGVHLSTVTATVTVPADAAPGSRVPVTATSAHGPILGDATVVVGEFPEIRDPALPLAVPGIANGLLEESGKAQTWRFRAKKGERLIVETHARRINSPLDPVIDILDATGRPVPRAVLRCVARTFVTFRDHDSAGSGIRLETWNELAIDDYVYAGGELMRIRALPRNPDDDCQFYSVSGQRVGYLNTTPSHHALATPLYKVTIHPPGTSFPPNGMPLFVIDHHNDDGGPGYGKDARVDFVAPADGEYQARVTDARGAGGRDFVYRLTVRPPRPDFSVSFTPTAPSVWRGGSIPATVTANRIDGFDGRIDVQLTNLPAGFEAPPTFIEPGQTTTIFAISATAKAANPDTKTPAPKLVATATINGQMVVRESGGQLPKAIEPGDLVTSVSASSVTLRPGQEARLMVTIERRNGFKGRVPLDVLGLPHGVRVLNVGLNGILITERESAREVVIYAEPWVQPMEHPIVVLARREGKGSEHGAPSVLLRVSK